MRKSSDGLDFEKKGLKLENDGVYSKKIPGFDFRGFC